MLWIADEVAQLPSLLVQLIDDNVLPFFIYVKEASVFIWSVRLVHRNAWWSRLGG
jgi:hypothetical protein